MNERLLSLLSQQHNYAEWQNTTTLHENLFVLGMGLGPDSFPGWEPREIRLIAPDTALASSHRQANSVAFNTSTPHTMQSFWRQTAGGQETLMATDLLQCSSRLEAHSLLLRLLGEFQALGVERIPGDAFGDVAFSGPGAYVVAFARANLVLFMRNAGRALTPLDETAAQFDQAIVVKPAEAETEDTLDRATATFLHATPDPQVTRGVRIELAEPGGSHKFYSSTGEVMLQGQRLLYMQQLEDVEQHLEVYTLTPAGAVRRTMEFGPT